MKSTHLILNAAASFKKIPLRRMRFWTACKLIAALAVVMVMALTAMLGYHVLVTPLGGVFEKIIPQTVVTASDQKPDHDLVESLNSAVLPDIDPGEKAFEKAREMLVMGNTTEAREKLKSIVETFPSSASAPTARRIIGEMNLDQILSTANMDGKQTHVVKRGNSFLGIAAEYKTTLDLIMHLNEMMELKGIQPNEELIVMPLEFRLLIEPQRKMISIWNGERFVCEYPIMRLATPNKLSTGRTTISSKGASLAGRQIPPQSKEYRAAIKTIQIAKPSVQIRSATESDDSTLGIILSPPDMEEISLLTRIGNEVEIR